MESGQRGLGQSPAAAALGVRAGRNGKGKAAAAAAGGRGSSSAAAPFSVPRKSGSAVGVFPVQRGSVPAAPLTGGGSSPIGSFTTSSTAAGFPFPQSQPPAMWGSDGHTPLSSSIGHADAAWDEDTQGLMRYFGSQAHNSHLVGASSPNYNVSTPVHENNGGSSPSEVELLSEQQGHTVTVNVEEENVRTEKRIMWTPKEDERLMNAWIENSTDSSTGVDRKGEAYWGDVIDAYNKDTPGQKKRNAKQAKDRWHKINKWCDLFESDYVKSRRVFTSGYNDEMWMEAAENFYLEHKLGPFTIKNVWKICREVAKWKTYNENLKNARKRNSYHLDDDVENVASEDEMTKRPMGQKAAKKAALAAKGKTKVVEDDGNSKESAIDVEKLEMMSKYQAETNAKRMKVLEMQQKLSLDKIEATRIAHPTAQENRESKKLEIEGRKIEMESKKFEMESKKLEKESKMMVAFNILISQDTTSMTDEEKSERVAAMKCLRTMLFPEIV